MLRHLERFLGPIFNREAVEIARRYRYYLSRVLYAVGLFVVLVVVWEEYRSAWYRLGPINAMAFMAELVFNLIWLRRWLFRNADRLAERMSPEATESVRSLRPSSIILR